MSKSPNSFVHEKTIQSCITITGFLNKLNLNNESETKTYMLLLKDLCWKISRLNPWERVIVTSLSWHKLLPESMKPLVPEQAMIGEVNKELSRLGNVKADVGIITILPIELEAIMLSVGLNLNAKAEIIDNRMYWFADIIGNQGKKISLVITCVGKPRNVPCAIAVDYLLRRFGVKLLVLSGIAAGPRKKVKLGHVACSSKIYDYEHMRREILSIFGIPLLIRMVKPRPEQWMVFDIERLTIGLLNENIVINKFNDLIGKIDPERIPDSFINGYKPTLHKKSTIVAGEKLFADGTLNKMYRKVDEEIRAADQEDSGFAQAAQAGEVSWCVFRGIVDYGDSSKNDRWHLVSALAAAATTISFLESSWVGRL